MNRIEGKLVKLAEEACEVAKEALKAAHYPNHVYDGQTAAQRLREELIDLRIVARILHSLGVIEPITEFDIRNQFLCKTPKIEKWTAISHKLGALSDPWVPTLEDVSRE
jgi:NTP pyrophosphatase (non-canonical NTP hydrolase)